VYTKDSGSFLEKKGGYGNRKVLAVVNITYRD